MSFWRKLEKEDDFFLRCLLASKIVSSSGFSQNDAYRFNLQPAFVRRRGELSGLNE